MHDYLVKKLEELEQRLDVIEGMLNVIMEELRQLKRSGGAFKQRRVEKGNLLRYVRERLFVDVNEVYSKALLRKLVESGAVILLRDEASNREILTTRDSVRKLYEKLPLQVSSVENLDEREYQLLIILNRLGYVILKDNTYVPTDLIKELL